MSNKTKVKEIKSDILVNIDDENIDSKSENLMTINLQPFIMPLSIVLSAIIISTGFFVGANNLSNSLKGVTLGTNTTATTTTGTAPTAAQPQATTVSLDTIKNLFKGDYIKFGDENRKILFVEVADPSCPYCHIAAGKNPSLNKQVGSQFTLTSDGGSYVAPVPEMKKLVEDGKASFLYIYTPGHGNGQMGIQALYCANEKGKFWEVHDLLMSSSGYDLLNTQVKNDKTKSQQVADFLKSAIDPTFIKNCIDSGKYDSRITSDPQIASSLGVQGTPGFFINDKSYAGAYSWKDMESTVNAVLK